MTAYKCRKLKGMDMYKPWNRTWWPASQPGSFTKLQAQVKFHFIGHNFHIHQHGHRTY